MWRSGHIADRRRGCKPVSPAATRGRDLARGAWRHQALIGHRPGLRGLSPESMKFAESEWRRLSGFRWSRAGFKLVNFSTQLQMLDLHPGHRCPQRGPHNFLLLNESNRFRRDATTCCLTLQPTRSLEGTWCFIHTRIPARRLAIRPRKRSNSEAICLA